MPPESSGKANFVAKSGKYCKYFKGMKADSPLKQLIRDVPPGTVIFRTDYPEYNAEFVGNVLSRLVSDGDIVRLSRRERSYMTETALLRNLTYIKNYKNSVI